MRKHMGRKMGLAVALATAVSAGWWSTTLHASDHTEFDLVQNDPFLDLTDLYVFESASGKTTAIACWAGLNTAGKRDQPDAEGAYSDKYLYTLHIDNNGDNVADYQVYWRYGKNSAGEYGVQFEGIPGVAGKVSGAVETVIDAGGGARVWSGHADDPFFFDAEGYLMTLDTGTAMFDSSRDLLAGKNVTAVAIEMDNAALGGGAMQFWITSAYK